MLQKKDASYIFLGFISFFLQSPSSDLLVIIKVNYLMPNPSGGQTESLQGFCTFNYFVKLEFQLVQLVTCLILSPNPTCTQCNGGRYFEGVPEVFFPLISSISFLLAYGSSQIHTRYITGVREIEGMGQYCDHQ